MLSTRLEQWKQDILHQGIEQGIERGIEQGEAHLLRQMLNRRFGPLPAWAEDKLSQANRDLLQQWGLKLL